MDDFSFDEDASAEEMVLDVIAQLYFVRPGIVQSFDPDTNTVTAIVAIQGKRILDDKAVYVTLPVIENVPVTVPFGAASGLSLTFPIRKDDPCILLFSDRMMDVFQRTGTFAPPEDGVGANSITTEPRMHEMTDAMCVPGLITMKHRIPDWNLENIELRDKERARYVSVGMERVEAKFNDRVIFMDDSVIRMTDGAGEIKLDGASSVEASFGDRKAYLDDSMVSLTDGAAELRIEDGRLTIGAPGGVYIDAPNMKVSGGTGWLSGTWEAANFLTTSGFNANSHRHGGVETGGGNTGTFV